jgi:hypothetical protein
MEYIHVLRPPEGRELVLPPPADGKWFTSAALLANGNRVGLAQDARGIRLTLGSADVWVPLGTVIRLRVDPATAPERNLALHKTVSASSSVESATCRPGATGGACALWMARGT